MKRNTKRRYLLGAAVILAVAALILVVFSLLSMTDKNDMALGDKETERFGWSYELLTDEGVFPYEPVFLNWYYIQLPEDTRAVRITRVMTEDIPTAELTWMSFRDGVEVSLDGILLYTDFPALARDENGFVHPDETEWERIWRQGGEENVRSTRMTLPEDYVGMTLTVTIYFREGYIGTPEYPYTARRTRCSRPPPSSSRCATTPS